MHNLVERISFSPRTLLIFLLSLGGFALSASARVVTVECSKSTISNALKNLDSQESNTVRVVGTCRDSIGIYDFADLTVIVVSFWSGGPSPETNPLMCTAAYTTDSRPLPNWPRSA